MNAKAYQPTPEILLLVRPFAHENPKALVEHIAVQAKAYGLKEPYRVVSAPPRISLLARGSLVVSDSLFRFGNTLAALKWLSDAIEAGIGVLVPNVLDLRPIGHLVQTPAMLVSALHAVGREARAMKIKESLFLRRQRGGRLGREPLTNEVQDEIVRTYSEVGSVRGVARRMQGRASRSSVFRTLRARGVKP